MGFFVYPAGSTSHKTPLQARDDAAPGVPISTGEITWRIGGEDIPEKQNLDVASFSPARDINTGGDDDFNFEALHAGSTVDFVVDGTDVATGTVLTNNPPTIDSETLVKDSYGVIPRENPRFSWTYEDADDDPMFFFRLMLGTAPGASDLYDSGFVFGNAGDANGDGVVDVADLSFVNDHFGTRNVLSENYDEDADLNRDGVVNEDDVAIVNLFLGEPRTVSAGSSTYSFVVPVTLPEGALVFWTLRVGDGEKVDPTDPEWPEPARKYAEATGFGMANSRPLVTNVKIDGA
jgi:hypothetical protein